MKNQATTERISNTGSVVLWMVTGGILAEIILCIAVSGYKIYTGWPNQSWVNGEFLFLSFLLVSSPMGWITFAIGSIVALFFNGKYPKP